jgi:hypothetical protein
MDDLDEPDELERAERLISDLVWMADHFASTSDSQAATARAILLEGRRHVEDWHRLRAADRFK